MANPEHIELLKKSTDEWNKWREENPENIPDLSKANLDGFHFRSTNFSKANLYKTILKNSNFQSANLSEANLSKADLTGVKLFNANLKGANLKNATLKRANLEGADISKAELDRANFMAAEVTEEQLLKANHIGARFGNRDLPKIYEDYKERHDECSRDVRRIGLALLSYAVFCFLSLGKSGEQILVKDEVTIPFADVPIDFQAFMVVGPLGLILISGYFHLFIHELYRYRALPHRYRLPYAFNLDNPFAQWLSNLVFYFLPPAVLFVFSVKSRVLLFSHDYRFAGEFWLYASWVVALYLVTIYWKHNLYLKKTNWKKTGSIFYGIFVLASGVYWAEVLWQASISLPNEAKLEGRDFSSWNLEGLKAIGANLKEAKLQQANLKRALLNNADLNKAELQAANLEYARLRNANFKNADLTIANLKGSNLEMANLQGANLESAILEGANIVATDMTDVKKLTCKQLESANVKKEYSERIQEVVRDEFMDIQKDKLDDQTKLPDYLEVTWNEDNSLLDCKP